MKIRTNNIMSLHSTVLGVLIVFMGLLSACGGGSESSPTRAATPQSFEVPNAMIQAVSGSAAVTTDSDRREPQLNTSGAIPTNSGTIIDFDPALPKESQTAIIKNQFWIFDDDRKKVDAILASKRHLTIMAWTNGIGYVIQLDLENRDARKELDAVRDAIGARNVFEVIYSGKNVNLLF